MTMTAAEYLASTNYAFLDELEAWTPVADVDQFGWNVHTNQRPHALGDDEFNEIAEALARFF